MVTIVDYKERTTLEEKSYFVLIIQGGVELVKSSTSDMHYATAMRCSIPTTFEELTCKGLIGKQLPGAIIKKDCEPYEVTNRRNGQVVTMYHRNVYSPEATSAEAAVFEGVAERSFF
jgi:hypothetical protein